MAVRCPNCSASNVDGSRYCAQCATPIPQSGSSLPSAFAIPAMFAPQGPFYLGKYHVQRVLGRGAMGVVYEALDTYIGRRVALKTIRLEVAVTGERAASLSRRLGREARAAGRLLHPNIVLVYEAGQLEGLNYIAMELVEGVTLAEHLDQAGTMPRRKAIGFALQVARALGFAHRSQIIHRDIKPSNLLIGGEERLKVTDFGLAKVLWESASLTREGGAVGTPAYMSPEQIAGKADDGRSDLFSLAAVFYQCLTGSPPFQAANVHALMYRILEGSFEPIQLEDADLQSAYSSFFDRALARDPEKRFPDAEAFSTELEALARLEPSDSDPLSIAEPTESDVTSRPSWPVLSDDATLELRGSAEAVESFQSTPSSEVTAPEPRRNVAILGFANLAGLTEVAWLSVALSEMLGSHLAGEARSHGQTALRIIPPERVARAAIELELPFAHASGMPQPPPRLKKPALARIGKRLGAELVVVGSILALGEKARGQLRLDLEVRETRSGKTLGTLSRAGLESELRDLAARAGDDLRRLLGVPDPSVMVSEAARSIVPSRPEALRPYCEGLQRIRLMDTAGAIDLLKKSITVEPAHPAAHAALAEAWRRLGYGARARGSARRAFELSSYLPIERRLSIEADYRRSAQEWIKAEALLRQLCEMFPDDVEHRLSLGDLQLASGRAHEALGTALAAMGDTDPRAFLLEARAAGALAEPKRQKEAAARAAETSAAREARLLLAEARLLEAVACVRTGEADRAAVSCSEARRIFMACGDRLGVGRALGTLAEIAVDQQNLVEARRTYEELLAVSRESGDKSAHAWGLTRLGHVLQRLGNVSSAKKRLQEALTTFRELDDTLGFTAALSVIAGIHHQQGDLRSARKMYEEAALIAQEGGDHRSWAECVYALGQILRARDGFDEARRRWREGLTVQTRRGEESRIARFRLALAELELEENPTAPVEPAVYDATAQFQRDGLVDDEAWAHGVLARVMAAAGRPDEARESLKRSIELAEGSHDRSTRIASRISRARVLLGFGSDADSQEALRELERALAEAQKAGLVGLQLEARLGVHACELALRTSSSTRSQIEMLEQEASARGFLLIARHARRLLA